MLVTMFTDASFNQRFNRATWAMWAKMNGNTIRYSGAIKETVPYSAEAELSAMANGLFCVKRQFDLQPKNKVICQTDCKEAIDALNARNHPRPTVKHVVNYIWAFVREQGWTLDIRHVKGHKEDATPRNAVNTWCDKECRRRMGELLKQLEDEAKAA